MIVNRLKREDQSNTYDYEIPAPKKPAKDKGPAKLRLIRNYEDSTDEKLVDLFVQENDEQAFNEIFNRYYEKIKRFALKKLNNAEEAEDIAQEVYSKLLSSLKNFRGESKFSTWLYIVSLNTIRMKQRKQMKDKRTLSIDDDDFKDLINNISCINDKNNGLSNQEQDYTNKKLLQNVYTALEQIPEKYSEAFILRDIKELSNEEAAQNLGISLTAVKSRVYRARQQLKVRLNSCK